MEILLVIYQQKYFQPYTYYCMLNLHNKNKISKKSRYECWDRKTERNKVHKNCCEVPLSLSCCIHVVSCELCVVWGFSQFVWIKLCLLFGNTFDADTIRFLTIFFNFSFSFKQTVRVRWKSLNFSAFANSWVSLLITHHF